MSGHDDHMRLVASSDIPTAKQKTAKKYIDAHAPSALETASAKLDVLLMLAVNMAPRLQ